MRNCRSRGDTIIEVMFSFVVFSLLTITTFVVMNRGEQIAQRSLEITLVRQQLDAQVSLIKYIHTANPSEWSNLISRAGTTTLIDVSGSSINGCVQPNSSARAFFIKTNTSGSTEIVDVQSSTYQKPQVYAGVDLAAGKSYGIFAQITKAETNARSNAGAAYDVYVNACWDSLGTNSAPVTIGTVTRIYDK